jgi:predicted site-specific integrase-resolvase
MSDNFIKGSKATKILGVHQRTLYQWEEKGWIETKRTKGGIRLYNVDKYLREIEKSKKETKKDQINNDNRTDNCDDIDEICKKETDLCINYIRVSSLGQKNDLLRQELYIKKKYPNNILIKDIGSGVNMNRRGLRKIIYLAIEGKLKQLVIVHKDRLTRFGFDLIKDLIKKYSNGELIILDKKEDQEPEEELVKDVLQIMNVFVARMNGMRKYGKKNKKNIDKV